MGTLADAFAEAEARNQENKWVAELIKIAKLAAFPWDLGHVRVLLDDHQGASRTIWIEFENFPKIPFRFKFDEWSLLKAFDPHSYLRDAIAKPLFDHLRYRPSLPVDDHIILGEE